MSMLLTVFLTIVFCAAITLMMFSAVAFIQNEKFFSSAGMASGVGSRLGSSSSDLFLYSLSINSMT